MANGIIVQEAWISQVGTESSPQQWTPLFQVITREMIFSVNIKCYTFPPYLAILCAHCFKELNKTIWNDPSV